MSSILLLPLNATAMRMNRSYVTLQFARFGAWNSDFSINSFLSDSTKEYDSPFVKALTKDVEQIDVAFGLSSFVFKKKLFFQIEGKWGQRLKLPDESLALLRCVWVDPRYRRQGLLKEFVAYLTAHAVQSKTAVILCPRPFEFTSRRQLEIDAVYECYVPSELTYGDTKQTEALWQMWRDLGFTLTIQDPAIGTHPALVFVPDTFEHVIRSEFQPSSVSYLSVT
jgi:GNAT superfamily N-acetyltransferase